MKLGKRTNQKSEVYWSMRFKGVCADVKILIMRNRVSQATLRLTQLNGIYETWNNN